MKPANFDERPNQERRRLQVLSAGQVNSLNSKVLTFSLSISPVILVGGSEEGSDREKTANPHDGQRSRVMI